MITEFTKGQFTIHTCTNRWPDGDKHSNNAVNGTMTTLNPSAKKIRERANKTFEAGLCDLCQDL